MAKLRRQSLFLISNIGLLLSMAVVIVQNSCGCYTEIPRHGPRLLRAKAIFGAVVRECHKEILFMFTNIEPKKFKQYMRYTCAIMESCMRTIPDNTTWVLLDCLDTTIGNKSHDVYTVAKTPEILGKAMLALLACFRARFGNESFETTTDSRAYAIKAIKEFGWV